MHHHLTTWFLVLLILLHMAQADQVFAQDCLEYCLKCGNNSKNYKTPSVSMRGPLEVSLQVAADGKLPLAQIIIKDSKPSTSITVNEEKVTLRHDNVTKHLTLNRDHPAFSWITLVLDPSAQNTLLVYTPKDKINVITANISHNSLVFVSSSNETHVAFNCLSGCLIRNTSSALVSREAKLQPPFTMYLNPRVSLDLLSPFRLFITPVFTLTPAHGNNKTVNASDWTPDTWHRVKVLVAKDNQKQNKEEKPQLGKDGVMEAQIWVANSTYTITRLRGFSWTLHCIPEGLNNYEGVTDAPASSASPNPEPDTEGATASTSAPETEMTGEGKKAGGAGATQVGAWVMAGLALFLVMVLALALCTKTARPPNTPHVYDSQPSVGILYCKGATREPDEDSEPESPNELKVPDLRNSLKPGAHCKVLEE